MKRKPMLLMVLGGFLVIACGLLFPFGGMSPSGMRPFTNGWSDTYASNGERIYFTAINERGEYIPYTGGPDFGGMMGGRLACVSCHGEDGRGGLHWMHMQQMDAPDIRYEALAGEAGEHGEAEHDEEYDLETFRKAVALGQHPDGEMLSRDMPRWQFNDEDLADLFEYLKSLP